MTVSALRDGTCIFIRSVVNGGAVSKDGRLKVGDGILAFNGEPTTNLSNTQARAMLRRHSLIGPELSVTYVPAAFLDMHRTIQSKQDVKASQATGIQSKQELKLDQATTAQSNGHKTPDTAFTKWRRISEQTQVEGGRVSEKSFGETEKKQAAHTTPLSYRHDGERKDEQEKEARDALQAKGWRREEADDKKQRRDQDSRSRPRRVTLIRTNGESLGIGVIGGRGMGRRLRNGEMRRGIFIKHVSENSPAARNNTLTPGDQILQVGGVDVSDFTHEEAVEAIRQAGDKVELLVQSTQVFTSNEDQSSQQNHLLCEDAYGLCLSPSTPCSPIPYKKYGGLPGELKLVELDCSTHSSGLGVCVSGRRDGRTTVYVSEIQPDGAAAADGQINVGDELLEINGQVLYGRSYQNAAAVINSASSKVKIVLIRNKAPLKHTATGSIMEEENSTITSPLDVEISTNKEHKQNASVIQEERMRLDHQKPCPSKSHSNIPPVSLIASSNHKTLHDPAPSFSHITATTSHHVPPTTHNTAASHTHSIHHKQSYCSSMINPSASGVQSSPYCSACSVRSDPLTCPIIPGCINIIDLCKGHSCLGLTIVGGCNTLLGVILIHEVNEGGAAHRDGRLMAGDHILEVNGIDLRMASHEEALSVLRLSPQHVRLCVYRHTSTHTFDNQATHTHEDMWDLFTVDLQFQPGQDLGLSIVDKRNDTGIFVSEIRQGGVVETDGRLSLGDQILSVNGEDIRAVTQDYARTLLQNCSGSMVLEIARFRATPHYSYECQNNLPGW
ncbi:hypothetical protein AMELA_G00274910 [Ameiurus melas]|uniref:PDZ domain-containing protein n=1 Tax=Ameiurus melas TaxID=219545 RepID=A0A7J5ZM50_AMEME|nr:hypothetical protein AMELA_G00274910 [Ameiurus melas]